MDAKEYIQRQFAGTYRLVDAIIGGTTDEQLNWLPPGTANSIKTALIHLLVSQDGHLHQVLQGKPRLWETQAWGDKIGLLVPPGRGGGWEEIKETTLRLAPILEYQQAVRGALDSYVADLTPEELDRPVTMFGGQRPAADALVTIMTHTLGHAGEIAALKGVQGVKGLPY